MDDTSVIIEEHNITVNVNVSTVQCGDCLTFSWLGTQQHCLHLLLVPQTHRHPARS